MMKKFQIKKGFTLLEMLVVIGIIAIMVSLSIASYSTAQKKARDAKRKADLRSFQTVMEQCYSINSPAFTYPIISVGSGSLSITANCTSVGGQNLTITDPTTKTYSTTSTTTSYSITITLEDNTTFTVTNQQ